MSDGVAATRRVPARFTYGLSLQDLFAFTKLHNGTLVPPPPGCPAETALPFGDLTTRQVVERLISPSLTAGNSYVGTQAGLRGGAVGANTYVVHSWDNPFCVLVETLLLRFNGQQARQDTLLWIDAFCAPQSEPEAGTAAVAGPTRFSPKHIAPLLAGGCSHVVCICTPWSSPRVLSRSWCYLELYTALTTPGVKFELLLGQDDGNAQLEAVQHGQAAMLLHPAENVRYSASQCSSAEDPKSIAKVLKQSAGSKQAVDATVIEPFLAWALHVAHAAGSPQAVQRVARGVAVMAAKTAHPERFRHLARSELLAVYDTLLQQQGGVHSDAALDALCDAADIGGVPKEDDKALKKMLLQALVTIQQPPAAAGTASVQVTALRFAVAHVAKRMGDPHGARVQMQAVRDDCTAARGADDMAALDATHAVALLLFSALGDLAGAEALLITELQQRCLARKRSLVAVSTKRTSCVCDRAGAASGDGDDDAASDVSGYLRHPHLAQDAATAGSYISLRSCACGHAACVTLGRVLAERGKIEAKEAAQGLSGAQLLQAAAHRDGYISQADLNKACCVTM